MLKVAILCLPPHKVHMPQRVVQQAEKTMLSCVHTCTHVNYTIGTWTPTAPPPLDWIQPLDAKGLPTLALATGLCIVPIIS